MLDTIMFKTEAFEKQISKDTEQRMWMAIMFMCGY